MKWFKHDSDANANHKLLRLQMKYGMEGYGLYWYCLELVAQGVDVHNLTFELEHDAEVIAHMTGIHYERVQEMMAYMVNQGLFENSGGRITCMMMSKRLDQSMTSNPRMRKLIDEAKKNHDAVMTESGTVMQEQNRTDKNRRDKKDTTAPSVPRADLEQIKAIYPKRAGQQPWKRAEKAISARLKEGHAVTELIDGTARYAAYCDATDATGTKYVQQAATFFGPEKGFKEPWTPPSNRSERIQDKSIAAALQWMEAASADQ